jgi:hypothetical protein
VRFFRAPLRGGDKERMEEILTLTEDYLLASPDHRGITTGAHAGFFF